MSIVSDPIGDLLTRMRNAQAARHASCSAPHSRLKQDLCALLRKEGWIADMCVTGDVPKRTIEVTFAPDKPRLELTRVSKPGRRVYRSSADMKPVLSGFGAAVLSISQGLMTDKEARAKRIGGEVLCTIA